jgi:hypothetical protein
MHAIPINNRFVSIVFMGPFMVRVPKKEKWFQDFLRVIFYEQHLHRTNQSEKNWIVQRQDNLCGGGGDGDFSHAYIIVDQYFNFIA